MTTPAIAPAAPSATRSSRGKDQIHWSEGVWHALDQAVMEEMMRTRVAAKFLPQVHVDRKQTTVASDVVIVPQATDAILKAIATGVPFDTALSVNESQNNRVQEYWTTFKLSVAQVETEEHEEMLLGQQASHPPEPLAAGHPHGHMQHHHRASTAVSLALRTANYLAQAEDLVVFNGQNAIVNSPLFTGGTVLGAGKTGQIVQYLDPTLVTDLDLGLLNIQPLYNAGAPPLQANLANLNLVLPSASQVIAVHPSTPGTATAPPIYAENSLNAVASAFSVLQALGHYEHYALALHTIPYADLHQALKTTLIEPVEPISHLIKAGIHGTGTIPPFIAVNPALGAAQTLATGLPTQINGAAINFPPLAGGASANVLYAGVIVSLSGNTVDLVRGRMEEHKDVIVTFNQKDPNEQYRFRVAQRLNLRLKDLTAVVVLLFMDS